MNKKRQLKTRGEAFDVYEHCTKDIHGPWPFPQYWIGDVAEFEVLHGRLEAGVDVRIGTVVQVFADTNGELCYCMKTEEEMIDISYPAFYGNWQPGEALKDKLKCANCNGTGLTKEAQQSLKKVLMSGNRGYERTGNAI